MRDRTWKLAAGAGMALGTLSFIAGVVGGVPDWLVVIVFGGTVLSAHLHGYPSAALDKPED